MKKFTIPCVFGGTKAPFDIYIGEPKEGNHPLQNQAAWLNAERGGSIPPDIMESFQKLYDLAKKNNVSFPDLCAHAFKAKMDQRDKEKAAPLAGANSNDAKTPQSVTPRAVEDVIEPAAPADTPGYVRKEKDEGGTAGGAAANATGTPGGS